MTLILRLQKAPQNIFKYIFTIFAETVLNYANFVFDPSFANQTTRNNFELLYRKCVKYTFGFNQNTPTDELFRALAIPTPQ